MAETIKLKRVRKSNFKVNHPLTTGGFHTYRFPAATSKKVTEVPVPKEVVDWLSSYTDTFKDGELIIVEDSEVAKEAVETLYHLEDYQANSLEPAEIEKLLKGNIMKMKSELNKITSTSEKRNIIAVADEMKDELPNGKLKALAEWMGVKQENLFGDDE